MISAIMTIPLTVTRKSTEGYWDEQGDYVEGGETTLDIICSIQPFKGKSRELEERGIYPKDAVRVYTKTELKTVDEFESKLADTATIDGVNYVAVMSENWARHSMTLNHYKVIFVREGHPALGDG